MVIHFAVLLAESENSSTREWRSIIIIPKVKSKKPNGFDMAITELLLVRQDLFFVFLKHDFFSSLLQLQLSLHLVSSFFFFFLFFYLITNITRHELQKAINDESFEIEEKASWHRCHTPFLFLHMIEVLPTSSWGYEIQCNQFGVK